MGLFDIFQNDNAEEAAGAKKWGLNAGYNDASELIGQGRGAITSYYDQAAAPFKSLILQTQGGSSAYADASGANGADGLARAKALFTQTPGYSEGINMTLDQNDRRAASRGMLNSGNTIADTTKLATDYASQKYGGYLAGLQPYLGAATSAAAGNAGVLTGEGSALNSSYGNQGNLAFQKEVGIGNADAAAALAKDKASENMWGAIGNVAGSAFKFAGAGGFG